MIDRPIQYRSRCGYFATDAMIALFIVVVLSAALAMAAATRQRSATRLAHIREATRLAEQALLDLQSGNTPRLSDGASLRIQRVESAEPSGGRRWVRVQVTVEGRGAELLGLVPAAGPTTPTTSTGGNTP